jgi:subfamily B ATP-binding cassette protein MsbA
MKTYFRLLGFAPALPKMLFLFLIFSTFSAIFSVVSLALITPLLDVMFNKKTANIPQQLPEITLSLGYLEQLFYYYYGHFEKTYGNVGTLQFVCIVVVTATLLRNLFKYFSQVVLQIIRAGIVRNLRQAIFDSTVRLHIGYFSNQRRGDIISRITSDVNHVEFSISETIIAVFREPLMVIGCFVGLFTISTKLTLFTLLLIPITAVVIGFITKRIKTVSAAGQVSIGQITGIISETLDGMRIIKGFNAEEYTRKKFAEENNNYSNLLRQLEIRIALASPVSEFLGISTAMIIMLYGGMMILEGDSSLTASQFITYLGLFSQIISPAKGIFTSLSNVQKGLTAGERIFSIIDEKPLIENAQKPIQVEKLQQGISFENVNFAYEDKQVLYDINLSIPKGKTIALVGSSGSGKSTIADLIPRFYDVQSGKITLDGHDIRDIELHSLRAKMGIVSQDCVLFNDTIFNNIAFGMTGVSQEQVEKAAKIANAHDFITQTEMGYQTIIGDKGVKLSGGQRQRLSIARAVLKNPDFLILDEATSALDTESEKLVQEALLALMQNRTTLVIAHRLSTIQNADQIVVLQQGKIVEQGTHEELVANTQGIYYKLTALQTL